jgi:hypothetical protein
MVGGPGKGVRYRGGQSLELCVKSPTEAAKPTPRQNPDKICPCRTPAAVAMFKCRRRVMIFFLSSILRWYDSGKLQSKPRYAFIRSPMSSFSYQRPWQPCEVDSGPGPISLHAELFRVSVLSLAEHGLRHRGACRPLKPYVFESLAKLCSF